MFYEEETAYLMENRQFVKIKRKNLGNKNLSYQKAKSCFSRRVTVLHIPRHIHNSQLVLS